MIYFVEIFQQLENSIEIINFAPFLPENIQVNFVIPRRIFKNGLFIKYGEELSFISKNIETFVNKKHE